MKSSSRMRTYRVEKSSVGTQTAASLLGISVSSVQKLVDSGQIEASRTAGGKRRRVCLFSISRFAKKMSISRDDWARRVSVLDLPKIQYGVRVVSIGTRAETVESIRSRVSCRQGGVGLEIFHHSADYASALVLIARMVPDLVMLCGQSQDAVVGGLDAAQFIRAVRSSQLHDAMTIAVSDDVPGARGVSDEVILLRSRSNMEDAFCWFIEGVVAAGGSRSSVGSRPSAQSAHIAGGSGLAPRGGVKCS
jgi:excisionase family DNA binding protein